MDGLGNYKSKLSAVEVLVEKMENGELSIPELSELESLTRELHERSIILKYKAFELQVSNEKPAPEPIKEVEKVAPPAVETPKMEEPTQEDETPALDFSLFDQEEVVEKIEEPVQVETVVETEVESTEIEEKPVEIEKPVEEVKAAMTEAPAADSARSFLERLRVPDNSIGGQFSGSKVENLASAFGIGERLRFIRELFDGSGDAFKEALEILDNQSSMGIASEKVEELAFRNSWDLEEETVLEFMAVIKRRYA